jgi:hypothetical protein
LSDETKVYFSNEVTCNDIIDWLSAGCNKALMSHKNTFTKDNVYMEGMLKGYIRQQ